MQHLPGLFRSIGLYEGKGVLHGQGCVQGIEVEVALVDGQRVVEFAGIRFHFRQGILIGDVVRLSLTQCPQQALCFPVTSLAVEGEGVTIASGVIGAVLEIEQGIVGALAQHHPDLGPHQRIAGAVPMGSGGITGGPVA